MTYTARHPDPYPGSVLKDIRDHARLRFPFESCGVIINSTYVPCENVHERPWEAFRIDPGFIQKHWDDIEAIIHSHPNGNGYPSKADMRSAIPSGKIWGLIPVQDGFPMEITWWGDPLPIPPLTRRSFIWNVFHCLQLYRDWWRMERGINIPNFPVAKLDFWRRDVFGEHCLESGHIDLGKPKSPLDLEIGDMLLTKINCRNPNHCAIYVGDDVFIHHPADALSQRGSVIREWDKLDRVFRYDLRNSGSSSP